MCVLLTYYFSRQAFLTSIPTHPPPPKWSINRPNALNLIYFRWRRLKCMCIKDLPAFSEYDQIRPIPPLMLPQILSLSFSSCVCVFSERQHVSVCFIFDMWIIMQGLPTLRRCCWNRHASLGQRKIPSHGGSIQFVAGQRRRRAIVRPPSLSPLPSAMFQRRIQRCVSNKTSVGEGWRWGWRKVVFKG